MIHILGEYVKCGIILVIQYACIFVELLMMSNYLNVVYSMKFSYAVIFQLIMFNCELRTNPQWSFG